MTTYVFNTFGNTIDEAYDMLTVVGDTNSFPGLARANFEKMANRFNKQFVDSVRLRTNEDTFPFITVADTTLDDASADSGDTTVTIALATGWPASGMCMIDSVPMTFTRSGTTLTVPALERDFDDGVSVQLAYAVPSDFWRPQSMFVDGFKYSLIRRGDMENIGTQQYALYGDYIFFGPMTTGTQKALMHFYKKPTATLTASDTNDVMEMWDLYIIYKLVAHGHGIMYDTERQAIYEQMAAQEMRKAKAHFRRLDASTENQFIPGF